MFALPPRMIAGARLTAAAVAAGFLLGGAAPGRAQSETATGATDPGVKISDGDVSSAGVEGAPTPAAATPEVEPPPPLEPHWTHRTRPALIAAGAVSFGASYIAALLTGLFTAAEGAADECTDCRSKAATIIIPVAGPWLAWRKEPGVWPAVWTGVEAAGAAMLVVGIVGHDVLEWRPREGGPAVSVAPAFTDRHRAVALTLTW